MSARDLAVSSIMVKAGDGGPLGRIFQSISTRER